METGTLEGTLEGSRSLEVQCVGHFESNDTYWQGRPVLTRPDLAAVVDLFAVLRSLALPVDCGKAKAGNAAGLSFAWIARWAHSVLTVAHFVKGSIQCLPLYCALGDQAWSTLRS